MDENNNFFGFVSKIGSLINNSKTKEKDTKKNNKGSAKKYNIKISADDEQTIENIDNQDEEEEEEEEEDEKEEQKQGEQGEKIEENKINEESEKEKEKIQNLVKEIMDNNDKDKDNSNDENEEEKEEDINNINNINNDINNNKEEIKNYNNIYCPPILNNSFPVINNNGNAENGAVTFVYDDTTSCHIMLKKGNDFNINDYTVIPILFLEKQKNLFYKMGMTNIPSYEPVKYLFFLDEHYFYFAKDEIIFLETDEETRRINKIVSLYDIKDFSTDNENDNFIIKLIVKKDEFREKVVSFYIDQKYFSGFMKNLNLKLSIYGIDFFSNKNKI